LWSIDASDVFVDIPGPFLVAVPKVAALPGVVPGQSAAWLRLAANPVIRGRVDDSFLDDNLVGSYSGAGSRGGDYFGQDRMTVVAGRLPGRMPPARSRSLPAWPGSSVWVRAAE
jgi:hypothetical protein